MTTLIKVRQAVDAAEAAAKSLLDTDKRQEAALARGIEPAEFSTWLRARMPYTDAFGRLVSML